MRDGSLQYWKETLDVVGMSVEPLRYVNYVPIARRVDAVPHPHSLRVPVTDCVRGRDGLSYPHERAIKLARGASRDIATVDGAAGGAVV